MIRILNILGLALVLSVLSVLPAAAQSGTIEEITVYGLVQMTNEAFLHALDVKEGDSFDEKRLRRQFQRLWKIGVFEDIQMESEVKPSGGRLLVIKVKERPVLTSATYQEVRMLTRTEIEDRLQERSFQPKLGKPVDLGKIYLTQGAIRDLLAEKGFLEAKVDSELRRVTESTRAVHFFIDPGGKTRIQKIEFTGNGIFTDRRLRGALELTEERRWWFPWSRKNLYHPGKWDQDSQKIREIYQNNGYLDVDLRPPVIEVKKKNADEGVVVSEDLGEVSERKPSPKEAKLLAQIESIDLQLADPELTPRQRQGLSDKRLKKEGQLRAAEKKTGKDKRWVYLTIQVREGEQYTLGDVRFEGNEAFPDEALRSLVPLRSGGILQSNLVDAGVDQISRLYEDLGRLYANVVRRIERRPGEQIADVVVEVDEDKPFYVGRIEFAGNTATRDKVLRRELLLMEGELFNRSRLDFSKIKINQLGYFQIPGEPVVEPVPEENRVNVTLAGQEQGRNEIQVGGGYSGFDGAFFNGVYSTRNFLGRGQIMSAALQLGGQSNRYQLSFQEPWFMNRPYRLGVSLFRRDIDFGASLSSKSSGGGLILGRRLTRFSQLQVGYNWESVESRTFLTPVGGGDSTTITTENEVSSFTPILTYNTINNPYRPTRGKTLRLSMQIAGGPLGGNTNLVKPIVTFTGYRKALAKTYLGFHAQLGVVREWQSEAGDGTASDVQGVPRFQRFWLGGDSLGPRVFETRSISPLRFVKLNENGEIDQVTANLLFQSPADVIAAGGIPAPIEVGGDRYFLLQSEYTYPLNEQAEIALFLDAGDALFEDQSLNLDTVRVSAGVELRFHLPIFPVPLRLIYGFPVREVTGDRTTNFTFSIGRSF